MLGNIVDIFKALMLVGILVGIGFTVMDKFQSQMTVDSLASNSTGDVIGYMADANTWIPLIVVAIIGFSILSYFGLGIGKQSRR